MTVAGSAAAAGGQGNTGGAGYSFTADIALCQGDTLSFVIGQSGPLAAAEGGGGGATFVYSGATALFVAGGGGGVAYNIAGQNAHGISNAAPIGGPGGFGRPNGPPADGSQGLPGLGGKGGDANGSGGDGGGGGGGTFGDALSLLDPSLSWNIINLPMYIRKGPPLIYTRRIFGMSHLTGTISKAGPTKATRWEQGSLIRG